MMRFAKNHCKIAGHIVARAYNVLHGPRIYTAEVGCSEDAAAGRIRISNVLTGRSRLYLLIGKKACYIGFSRQTQLLFVLFLPYYQKSGAAFRLLMLDHRPSFGQPKPVCQDSDDEKSESGSETKTTECEKQPTPQLACSRPSGKA